MDRNIEELVGEFCNIVLTRADEIDKKLAEEFITNLSEGEQHLLNTESLETKKQSVRAITQKNVYRYISSFEDNNGIYAPFSFDSANEFFSFKETFFELYKNAPGTIETHVVFYYVLDYIKEASETYRLFEKFYENRQKATEEKIEDLLNSTNDKFKDKSKKLTTEALIRIGRQAKKSTDKMIKSTKAASEELSKKVSEISVTILGIFSGIVVTIVAGLFYSSSVLNNLNNSNIFRLVSIVSLIGLVTYYLVYAMFYFIFLIKGDNTFANSSQKLSITISIILGAVFLVTFCLQVFSPKFVARYDINNQLVRDSTMTNAIQTINTN